MATQHSEIQISNFDNSWAVNGYSFTTSSKQDVVGYIYVCAPCWYLVVACNYAIFGGSGIFQIEPYYWDGSSWVDCGRQETNASSGATTHYYGHNRVEAEHKPTKGWNNKYPLWKITYWSSRDNDNGTLSLYAGGWGLAKNVDTGEILNYPQGKRIYSIGYSKHIYHTGTQQSDELVLNDIFNPENKHGDPILASFDSELICAPYLDNTY